jgi:hypothetical protein
MKRLKFLPWLFILAGVVLLCFAMGDYLGPKIQAGEDRLSAFFTPKNQPNDGQVEERPSITFILGEDEDSTNSYYTLATEFYKNHPSERTETVVTGLRSLLAVRDYLAVQQPIKNVPWGRVNLVVHGNEWSGLAVPVLPDGQRTIGATLAEAVGSKALRPLPDFVADACTEFRIEGCGVGRDTTLLLAIRQALGGDGELPQVVSSPYFIHFSTVKKAGQTVSCKRELLEAWYAFYPKTYRPATAELARRFQKSYPKTQLDWQAALTQNPDSQPSGGYCHEFDLPVVWVVAYPDEASLPDLTKWREQRKWLTEQPELLVTLRDYEVPLDNFQWTFLKTKHQLGDGTEVPAIRAIGLCTVLTVLRGVRT